MKNKHLTWLKDNSNLRMDANIDCAPQRRRDFHKERYNFASNLISGRRVLDGACGTGYGSSILSEKAQHVVGIDLEREAIAYANDNYSHEKCEFKNSFVEYTPFDDSSFDAVVSFETIEHTICPSSHFREIVRLLKSDGIAVLSVPNGWGFTDHHFFDFDLD